MLRYIVSWAIASLHATAAFLNADLPAGRVVVLRPSTILYKLVSSPLALSGECTEQFMALERHPLFVQGHGDHEFQMQRRIIQGPHL